MTVAEMRKREVRRLAEFNRDVDFENASRLMNSFYRLCGLCERNLELANDSEIYNPVALAKSEERESRWYDRLNAQFEKFYGLQLVYCGYMPSIGIVNENGGFTEKVNRFFY